MPHSTEGSNSPTNVGAVGSSPIPIPGTGSPNPHARNTQLSPLIPRTTNLVDSSEIDFSTLYLSSQDHFYDPSNPSSYYTEGTKIHDGDERKLEETYLSNLICCGTIHPDFRSYVTHRQIIHGNFTEESSVPNFENTYGAIAEEGWSSSSASSPGSYPYSAPQSPEEATFFNQMGEQAILPETSISVNLQGVRNYTRSDSEASTPTSPTSSSGWPSTQAVGKVANSPQRQENDQTSIAQSQSLISNHVSQKAVKEAFHSSPVTSSSSPPKAQSSRPKLALNTFSNSHSIQHGQFESLQQIQSPIVMSVQDKEKVNIMDQSQVAGSGETLLFHNSPSPAHQYSRLTSPTQASNNVSQRDNTTPPRSPTQTKLSASEAPANQQQTGINKQHEIALGTTAATSSSGVIFKQMFIPGQYDDRIQSYKVKKPQSRSLSAETDYNFEHNYHQASAATPPVNPNSRPRRSASMSSAAENFVTHLPYQNYGGSLSTYTLAPEALYVTPSSLSIGGNNNNFTNNSLPGSPGVQNYASSSPAFNSSFEDMGGPSTIAAMVAPGQNEHRRQSAPALTSSPSSLVAFAQITANTGINDGSGSANASGTFDFGFNGPSSVALSAIYPIPQQSGKRCRDDNLEIVNDTQKRQTTTPFWDTNGELAMNNLGTPPKSNKRRATTELSLSTKRKSSNKPIGTPIPVVTANPNVISPTATSTSCVVAAPEADKPYKCAVPGCPKTYKNANGLKYHKAHGHTAPQAGGNERSAEKPYKCSIEGCAKSYKNLNGLKYHLDHHHKVGADDASARSGTSGSISSHQQPSQGL